MGQYQCPDGYTAKSGSPNCAGAVSSFCTATTCCDASPTPAPTPAPPTCATYSVVWGLAQLVAEGCAADTKFFDLKTLATEVASPQGDDDIKASCCTDYADATCADWVLMTCPSGHALAGANSAPGGGANGMTLSQGDFESDCCETAPSPTPAPLTCSSFSIAWAVTQLAGGGCATDTKFFDLKKLTDTVSSSADADVRSACCTAFSEAVCSDWVLMTCASGQYTCAAHGFSCVGTTAAPADGDDGMTIGTATFRSSCCSYPISCADYSEDGGEDASSAPAVSASISAASVAFVAAMWA